MTISLPLPAASNEDGCESIAVASTELVTIAGLVFKSSASPVVVDVVRDSTAAADPRLQHAMADARLVRLVRVNTQAVDNESWFECLMRAVASPTEQQTVQLQFETDECPGTVASGAGSKQTGVDSRTSIAWNSSRALHDEMITKSAAPGIALGRF